MKTPKAVVFHPFQEVGELLRDILLMGKVDAIYAATNGTQNILGKLRQERYDLVVIASRLSKNGTTQEGLEVLAQSPDVPIVIVEYGEPCKQEAMRLGAKDYLQLGVRGYQEGPMSPDEIKTRLLKALEPQSQSDQI